MCRQDGRAADAARERDGCAPAEGAGRADAMDGELGARIRAQRVRCGLSQEQLAGQVGVSRQAVTKWETGRAAPGAAHLFRLAQALGTTVDLLLPRAGTGADGADAARAAQEARIRARRARWKRRGALALAVAGAYLLLYLAGRLADGDLSQRTVLEVLFGRDDPAAGGYLFGWLLSRRLLVVSFAASVLPALLGAPPAVPRGAGRVPARPAAGGGVRPGPGRRGAWARPLRVGDLVRRVAALAGAWRAAGAAVPARHGAAVAGIPALVRRVFAVRGARLPAGAPWRCAARRALIPPARAMADAGGLRAARAVLTGPAAHYSIAFPP